MPPRRKRGTNDGRPQPPEAGKQPLELRQDPPVVSRVGNQEQEVVRWVIPSLEIDASPEGLDVAESHLQLDRSPFIEPEKNRVPGAALKPIHSDREWYLDPIRQWISSSLEESEQAACLSSVANRYGIGVQAEARREPEDGGDPVQLEDGRGCRLAAFDQPVPAPRHARAGSDVLLTLSEN